MKRWILPLLLFAAAAPAARADVRPAGTGEPAYTNTATNTQWFEWTGTTGAAYRARFDMYANNVLVDSAGPVGLSGTGGSLWVNWQGVATLQHGGQYGICGQGQFQFPNDSIWFADSANSCSLGAMSGKRSATVIDRAKPAVAATLGAGAAATKNPSLALDIAFTDDLAGPFPANWVCVTAGDGACTDFQQRPACSQPETPGKSTTFTCTIDAAALPDGAVNACVVAADASVPDNPRGADQSGSAADANLSDAKCDAIVLDRVAPTLAIGEVSAVAGTPVAFTATAADATSGLDGEYAWAWGDGSAGATGESVQHTFASAGTFDVTVTTADAAGNETVAHRTVVVAPASTPTPTPTPTVSATPTPSATATPEPTTTATPAPTGTATPVPTTTPTATASPTVAPTSSPTPAATAIPTPALRVLVSAPKRLAAKARRLPVTITSSAPATVRLALVRDGRIVAQATTAVGAGSTGYRLKLPRKLKAGRYQLTVTHGAGVTTRAVAIGRPKPVRRRSAAVARLHGNTAKVLPDRTYHGPSGDTFRA